MDLNRTYSSTAGRNHRRKTFVVQPKDQGNGYNGTYIAASSTITARSGLGSASIFSSSLCNTNTSSVAPVRVHCQHPSNHLLRQPLGINNQTSNLVNQKTSMSRTVGSVQQRTEEILFRHSPAFMHNPNETELEVVKHVAEKIAADRDKWLDFIIKKNRGSAETTYYDVSALFDDISFLERSSFQPNSQRVAIKELYLRKNELLDEIRNFKKKINSIRAETKHAVEHHRQDQEQTAKSTKRTRDHANVVKANDKTTRLKFDEVQSKILNYKVYRDLVGSLCQTFFKTNDEYLCTDAAICRECHQQGSACFEKRNVLQIEHR